MPRPSRSRRRVELARVGLNRHRSRSTSSRWWVRHAAAAVEPEGMPTHGVRTSRTSLRPRPSSRASLATASLRRGREIGLAFDFDKREDTAAEAEPMFHPIGAHPLVEQGKRLTSRLVANRDANAGRDLVAYGSPTRVRHPRGRCADAVAVRKDRSSRLHRVGVNQDSRTSRFVTCLRAYSMRTSERPFARLVRFSRYSVFCKLLKRREYC